MNNSLNIPKAWPLAKLKNLTGVCSEDTLMSPETSHHESYFL